MYVFDLYANATINVRRSLLELYEKYFVALGPLLKPALIGFLNGLLPGRIGILRSINRFIKSNTSRCRIVVFLFVFVGMRLLYARRSITSTVVRL